MSTTTPATSAVGIPSVEPTTQAFLDQLTAAGGPALYTLSPEEARGVLRSVQESVAVHPPPTVVEDRVISGGPTGEVNIRIVKPEGVDGVLPGIVYTHGGGWILGDKDTHLRLVQELSIEQRRRHWCSSTTRRHRRPSTPSSLNRPLRSCSGLPNTVATSVSTPPASRSRAKASAATWSPPSP